MVKKGACIIDVGITRTFNKETGKSVLVGDVDFEGNYAWDMLQNNGNLQLKSERMNLITIKKINLQHLYVYFY